MYPMDYEEFKGALGEDSSFQLLRDAFFRKKPLGDSVNRKLLRDFRLYMMVGGMPQAVESYLNTKNLSMVDQVKREIIELYADDFRKIDPTGKITRLFRAIPSELSRNAKRYLSGAVIGTRTDDNHLDELLEDMEDSLCVNCLSCRQSICRTAIAQK